MQHRTVYQLDKTDFDEVIAERLARLQNETVLARYRDRLVSANVVAEIHNVHRNTVIKYAQARLIPHRRDGKLYKFSLADVLQIDFNELRRVG